MLIYAVNSAAREHQLAKDWLADAFAAPSGVGLAWLALVGFIRLTTRSGLLPRPLSVEDSIRVVEFWLAQPRVRVLHPTEQHISVLSELLAGAGGAGNLANDAHLAALAIEHGATLASFDRDFDRFDQLDFEQLRA